MIGNMPEKDMSFLEERIKRSQLSRPPPGSTGPTVAAAAAPVAAAPPPQPQPAQPAIPEPRSGIPGNRNRNIPPPGSGLSGLKRYQAHQQQSQLQQMQQQQPQAPSDIPTNVRRSPPSGSGLFGRDRPVSGVFSLDLDKIENGGDLYRSNNGSGPKLVSHNLDEIFGDDGHVRLPPTISSARNNLIGGGYHYAPPAMSMPMQPQRNLIESPEAYEALDVVLAQVRMLFGRLRRV